ncbi:InlB B-repeat-containing protein [Lysinibacillus sphaericus]|uniref:InlB B-repeat-containing protein n=1 Tax=Lysinibacillus sphaericus TaxID=1421 RepID=UPI0021631238|nr:InlB B-repeat-containing protein [Lysinibacillus sphaericus]MCS1384118.1 InlB B-repeat-containing protein [Lysinibacillus sphaericus]
MRKKFLFVVPVTLFLFVLLFNENKVLANNFTEDGFIYNDNITGIVPEMYYPGGVTIYGDNNPSRKDLVIPDTLGGKPVTNIWYESFNNKQLTSLILSNNVKLIGYNAFDNNLLTSVVLPNQLEWIGDFAFANNKLSSITIPDTVKRIGQGAFVNNDLQTITILSRNTIVLPNAIPKQTKILGTIPSKAKEYADQNGNPFEYLGFTITYDGNGHTSGSVAADYIDKTTQSFTVKKQESLKKDGYVFTGWNTERDGSGTDYHVDEVKTMTGDLTLYAIWLPQQHVTFNTDGGSIIPPQFVNDQTLVVEPPAPTKQGHTFEGWYKEAALTNKWDFMNDVVSSPITLYAKWKVVQHEVTFNTGGGSAMPSQLVDDNTVLIGPSVPMKQGYIFAGWYKEAALINQWDLTNDVVTSATTLFAKWKVVQYEVTFNTNGGSGIPSQMVDINMKINEPTIPIKQGYTFGGWYKEATLTNGWDFKKDTITGKTTLFAKWFVNSSPDSSNNSSDSSPQNVTVYFETNGGSVLGHLSVAYDTKIATLQIPKKEGYTFGGWYKEAALINEWDLTKDRVTKETKLYAKWIANIAPKPTPEPSPEQTTPEPDLPKVSFHDIAGHWAKEMIEEIASQGIITGYSDGSFRPNEFIQRQHVALLFYRAFEFEPTRNALTFSDVTANHPYYEAITTLQQAGIVDGSQGKFNPNALMTRAQLAKVVTLALKIELGGSSTFQDVPPTHWSYGYIAALAELEIVIGDNGKFKPDEPVTRAQFVAILYRALNLR